MATITGPALLASFLADHKITQKAAAEALHVHRPVISLWLNGHVNPQLGRRRDIEAWTRGKVPASAWESETETTRTVEPFEDAANDETEPEVARSQNFRGGRVAQS